MQIAQNTRRYIADPAMTIYKLYCKFITEAKLDRDSWETERDSERERGKGKW